MRHFRAKLFAALLLSSCTPVLKTVEPPPLPRADTELFAARGSFLKLIDDDISFLRSDERLYAHREFPSRELVLSSLSRFRDLILQSQSAAQLEQSVAREFEFYSSGRAQQGQVLFTGYYQPLLRGSLQPTSEFQYPLYGMIPGLSAVNPTRRELEERKLLRGHELVYLDNPVDGYLAQVQGSTAVKLDSGEIVYLSFAGATDYPYVSVGAELIRDGKLPPGGADVKAIREYFRSHPGDLHDYLWRNNRFVFFRRSVSPGAKGSLGLTLLGGRSIATDKRIYPPGALALYECIIPGVRGLMDGHKVRRYALDLDTGSAITGADRVDLYLGEGDEAGEIAGQMQSRGDLYHLLLRQ